LSSLKGFYKSTMTFGRYFPFYGPDIVPILVGTQVIKFQPCPLKNGLMVALKVAFGHFSQGDLVFS
jgi:hypothetical protein